ncbi:Stress regulated protein [Melia azedarach]|uniref:Stress regulated protein n=1 Tax=Melia azedarach TaxID=155640 RepID=A0ACC1Y8Q8_MELAZ|nr:Stress regulated protein [Melia azedarach]
MYSAISWQVGRELVASGKEAEFAIRRRRALKRVDKELSRGNFKTALSLVKQLQRNPAGGLRGFGAVKQVPKRVTSLNELELDSKELLPLQSLLASVMESIERCNFFDSFDEAASDRVESLTEDESYGSLNEKDHSMCMQHEAGHFLVGYLLGVLPKGYNVPSIEALRQEESAVGSVQFIGFEFLKEIALARRLRRTYTAQGDGRTKRHTISSKVKPSSCLIYFEQLFMRNIRRLSSRTHSIWTLRRPLC